jgi:DNA-binding NarL/FixJ family response regulator
MSRRPRVLLADDDAGVRTAITRLLSPACEVVGDAADTGTALDAAFQLRPDVVLLDLSLPGASSGLDVCRRIKAIAPEVHVVIFTATDDEMLRRLTREAGASGYVWKMRATGELLTTIQAIVGTGSLG